MNSPVFSPMIVLPLEAEALPVGGEGRKVVLHINVVRQSKNVELGKSKSAREIRPFREQKGIE